MLLANAKLLSIYLLIYVLFLSLYITVITCVALFGSLFSPVIISIEYCVVNCFVWLLCYCKATDAIFCMAYRLHRDKIKTMP